MRTIRIKKRSMLRTLQRRSGLFTLVQDLAHAMSKFFTRQRLTIALSHWASIYAQRVNFLRAHRVPRWDGPK
jgi:hypothetical protein